MLNDETKKNMLFSNQNCFPFWKKQTLFAQKKTILCVTFFYWSLLDSLNSLLQISGISLIHYLNFYTYICVWPGSENKRNSIVYWHQLISGSEWLLCRFFLLLFLFLFCLFLLIQIYFPLCMSSFLANSYVPVQLFNKKFSFYIRYHFHEREHIKETK